MSSSLNHNWLLTMNNRDATHSEAHKNAMKACVVELNEEKEKTLQELQGRLENEVTKLARWDSLHTAKVDNLKQKISQLATTLNQKQAELSNSLS
ncbi:hypothetical protein ACH5RR_009270 [Cinchona calisaya]|uniref:Uncharacterized protein n=1 Tax=Cinchona calisaya TaxID=153742 RepID=A0ABD3AEH5_9GENT